MRRFDLASLARPVALSTVLVAAAVTSAHAESWCASRTNEHATGLLSYVQSTATKPGSERDAARSAIGLPRVDSTAIVAVGDERICRQAAAVLNRHLNLPESTVRAVYVVKAGPVYWVEDPSVKAGEYIRALVLDSTLSKVLGIPGR